jgi:hypothetical protein
MAALTLPPERRQSSAPDEAGRYILSSTYDGRLAGAASLIVRIWLMPSYSLYMSVKLMIGLQLVVYKLDRGLEVAFGGRVARYTVAVVEQVEKACLIPAERGLSRRQPTKASANRQISAVNFVLFITHRFFAVYSPYIQIK